VIGCAAQDVNELLVLELLGSATFHACEMQVLDEQMLPSRVAEKIAVQEPAAVVVSVVPRGGFDQARFLCRSIREAGYAGPIIVACFGKFKHFDRLFVKFRKAGATRMTTTFQQTQAKLVAILGRIANDASTNSLPAATSTSSTSPRDSTVTLR
ncbi:MAG: hypothetical protein KDA45_14925, partial [Planctomycetales bacterium]|nr:hypothetical protein [Planctomycetales bacterium]